MNDVSFEKGWANQVGDVEVVHALLDEKDGERDVRLGKTGRDNDPYCPT